MSKHSISLLETWSGERSAELVATSETRNPKPTVKVGFELRNPKPETDSEDLTPQDGSKPETRNRLWRLNFPRANRNPKTRKNPKPETRNRKLVSSDETRNPKPTAKVGFNQRNPKPETDSNPTFGWLSGSELVKYQFMDDLPSYKIVILHSFVNVYQRVNPLWIIIGHLPLIIYHDLPLLTTLY